MAAPGVHLLCLMAVSGEWLSILRVMEGGEPMTSADVQRACAERGVELRAEAVTEWLGVLGWLGAVRDAG